MKKILLIGGAVLMVGSVVWYLKRQIDLALNYDYKIIGMEVVSIENGKVELKVTLQATNKSNFGLRINKYLLNFYSQGQLVGTSKKDQAIIVPPDGSFEIIAPVTIDQKSFLDVTLSTIKNAIQEKPIEFQIDGALNVTFVGITRDFVFDKETFVFSENILAEYNLSDEAAKVRNKLSKLGIKI